MAERRDSPPAWFHSRRGLRLYEKGDVEGAERELRRADELGGAWGAFRLGFLLEQRGDITEAEAAYRRGVERRSVHAAGNLGVMLEGRGDLPEALRLYRLALEWSEDADRFGSAVSSLEARLAAGAERVRANAQSPAEKRLAQGIELAARGDLTGALAAYQAVIESGDPEQVPFAWFDVGVLKQAAGDAEGATQAYLTAMASRHPHATPRAAVNLGVVRSGRGDWDGAREAFRIAIATAHPEQAPLAARNLAAIHELHGDTAEAARLLAQADAVEAAPPRTDLETAQAAHAAARELRTLSARAHRDGRDPAEVEQLATAALAHATAAFAALERSLGTGVTVPEVLEEICFCAVHLDDVTPGPPNSEDLRAARNRLRQLASTGSLSPEARALLNRLESDA